MLEGLPFKRSKQLKNLEGEGNRISILSN